jgi:hypothetical protein
MAEVVYRGRIVHIDMDHAPLYEQTGYQPVANEGEQHEYAGDIQTVPAGFLGFPMEGLSDAIAKKIDIATNRATQQTDSPNY